MFVVRCCSLFACVVRCSLSVVFCSLCVDCCLFAVVCALRSVFVVRRLCSLVVGVVYRSWLVVARFVLCVVGCS